MFPKVEGNEGKINWKKLAYRDEVKIRQRRNADSGLTLHDNILMKVGIPINKVGGRNEQTTKQ
jgi:hypothetical protein